MQVPARLAVLTVAFLASALFQTHDMAAAATVSVSRGMSTPGAMMRAWRTVGTVEEGVTGSIRGQRLSPFEGTRFSTASYTAIGKRSAAIYRFAGPQRQLDFIWGSADGYNRLAFFYKGRRVASMTGADLAPGRPARRGHAVVSVSGILFDKLRFTSARKAFEIADLKVQPVPVPAGMLLMLSALGGLGLVGGLRRGRG